jgi:hypothetical protein
MIYLVRSDVYSYRLRAELDAFGRQHSWAVGAHDRSRKYLDMRAALAYRFCADAAKHSIAVTRTLAIADCRRPVAPVCTTEGAVVRDIPHPVACGTRAFCFSIVLTYSSQACRGKLIGVIYRESREAERGPFRTILQPVEPAHRIGRDLCQRRVPLRIHRLTHCPCHLCQRANQTRDFRSLLVTRARLDKICVLLLKSRRLLAWPT